MFNSPTITGLIYHLNTSQQERLILLFKEFQKEGIVEHKYVDNYDIVDIINDIEYSIKFEEQQQLEINEAIAGRTTIPEDCWGVHETHCCIDHGCKYGKADCPVFIGLIKQQYKCESCDEIYFDH